MVSPSSPSYVYMSRRQRVAFEDTTSTPVFLRKEFGPQHHYFKDNNKPREVTEKTKEVFYEELKPLWIVQMVFGMFPFQRPRPGHTNLKFFSAIVLYCFAWYAMLGYMDVFVALRTFGNISNSGLRFNEVILPCNILLYLIPPLMSVPTHLWDGNKMADYFNLWWRFQISFERVTGRPLELELKKYTLFSTVSLLVMMLAYLYLATIMIDGFPKEHAAFYVYCTFSIGIQVSTWCFTCLSLKISATKLSSHFESVLHTISEKQVATYRDLWLQLSKLSNYSGNANQGTVGQILVFIFVTTLLSLYGVLSGLLSYKYGLTEIVLSINSVMGLITTTLTCDFAHKAYEQIGTNFVGQLSEDMSVNKAIEKEMRLFLSVAVANPPEISLGGFAVINRNMTVSMMSMMVTYLVVLAQFGFQDEK